MKHPDFSRRLFCLPVILLILISAPCICMAADQINATFDSALSLTHYSPPDFIPGQVIPTAPNSGDRPSKVAGNYEAFKVENADTIAGPALTTGNFLRITDQDDYTLNGAWFDFYDRTFNTGCVRISWDVLFEMNGDYYFYFRNGRADDVHHPAKSSIADIYTSGASLYFTTYPNDTRQLVVSTSYETGVPIHFDTFFDMENNRWAVVIDGRVIFNNAEIMDAPLGLFIPGHLNDPDYDGAMQIDNLKMTWTETCQWPENLDECSVDIPDPVLTLRDISEYSNASGEFMEYKLSVSNWDEFPAELFAPSPDLPPCGRNTEASRAWVNIFDASGNYLYGFCTLGTPEDLTKIWLRRPKGGVLPDGVKIVINDRLCGKEYTSNIIPLDADISCTPLPVPQLAFTGTEGYSTSAGSFTRYKLSVTNWQAFPAELFTPSPELPPCGLNNESSRTWLDIYDESSNRIYGFCALEAPGNLTEIWFSVQAGETPPEAVKIVMTDRQCELTAESAVIPLENQAISHLSITVNGSGRVISENGVSCSNSTLSGSSTCTFDIMTGRTLTLKGIPIDGDSYTSSFVKWSDACSGSGNCTLTITQDTSVTADFAALGIPVQTILPVPVAADVFIYEPVAFPVLDVSPSGSMPFATGDMAGGQLVLQAALPPFAGPVDIYLGIQAAPVNPFEIYLLVPVEPFGYTLAPLSTSGMNPWQASDAAPVFQNFFGEIPLSSLPPGPYTLYTLVTPANSISSYYLWVTTFTVP